jgi:hypothetical protein
MKDRDGRTATVAKLQLLASQLVEDLRDVRAGLAVGELPEERHRLETFRDLISSALRGAAPAFHERGNSARERGGRLTPTRSKKLATLDQDQEVFGMVRALRGGRSERDAAQAWAQRTEVVLTRLLSGGWDRLSEGDRTFIEQELETFLERMQRLDESEDFVPRRRASLTA